LSETSVIRVVLGFLLAPILPMAPFIVLNFIVNHSLQGAGPFLVLGILYVYPVMLVVGVPLYIHARAKGIFTFERTVQAAALTGTAIGVIVPISFISQTPVFPTLCAALLVGLIGALIGAAVGFTFWQIAGRSAQLDSSGT
jgi:hypothetical protein